MMLLRGVFAELSAAVDKRVWSSELSLSEEARSDLRWLASNLAKRNGRMAWRPARVAVLAADASEVGWGVVLLLDGVLHRGQGYWLQDDLFHPDGVVRLIHLLEIRAVCRGVESLQHTLCGRQVQVVTDNSINRYTLMDGSRVGEINTEVRAVQDRLSQCDATLVDVAWVPTESMQGSVMPDGLSRLVDPNDWLLAEGAWTRVQARWPQLAVDRFADHINHRLPVWNSRWAHPQSGHCNAFSADWTEGGLSYACPPLALVGQVQALVVEQRAQAVVIVPLWEQQVWWPILRRIGRSVLFLGLGSDAFCAGRSGECSPHHNPAWHFAAVLVDGSTYEQ
jgi:hypothetical protein